MNERIENVDICRIEKNQALPKQDSLAVEEPLELRLVFGPEGDRKTRSLAITMRTPGHDFEFACGFLVSEGIVKCKKDILDYRFCGPIPDDRQQSNVIEIDLSPDLEFEFAKLQRNFYTTSSCGICGKASLESLRADNIPTLESNLVMSRTTVFSLPHNLRQLQKVFLATGGLHGAALARPTGEIIEVREDIGRHNAVDKLVGSQILAGAFPLQDSILVLSGRASFELMQKSLLASIPIVVAVGAPSSLAVELAIEFGQTLIGFASESRFNIYSGSQRIVD